ncbi:N-acetylmuramoyl-L-alanine amidase family protein [Massilia suwonensis]|uniref:N-acetylmuramoyl-L-alanine amidase n=1 Tax=Massilia suwonensis TaxID=648895 RepID=A0ABW0MHS8_9BURK
MSTPIRRGALCILLAGGTAGACDPASFPVAIDPGHTPRQPGAASARGIPEVRFNDELAAALVAELAKAGFPNVALTREPGEDISLLNRSAAANRRGARLFVSIHHDSVQPRYLSAWEVDGRRRFYSDVFSGYSLFFSRDNADPASSLAFARLLGTRLRTAGFVPTLHHAQQIQGEKRELVDAWRGIYRFDALVVLKSARMPALLVEAGIIVNRHDEPSLREPAQQRAFAHRIALAVADFCEAGMVQP